MFFLIIIMQLYVNLLIIIMCINKICCKALRYQAPGECKWYSVTLDGTETELSASIADDQEVALSCRLQTINSELEKTDFSVIQAQYTVKLKIECAQNILVKSAVSVGSFQTLIDLRDLTIDYCKIDHIVSGSFKGLRKLRNLTVRTFNSLANTYLQISNYDVFQDLPLLERIDFSNNNLRSIPEGIFCQLSNLNHLNLTGNKLSSIQQFQFAKKCNENLRLLDLSNNTVDSIPERLLTNLIYLEELYLQDNSISFIDDHAFYNLSSLSVLNLAHNKLVNLPPELFTHSRDIKEIHLQNNSINVLAPGLFNNLNKLLVLDLSDNDLTEEWVNSATFIRMDHLIVLNLCNNNISKLDPYIFRDLHNLQVLRLEHNGIREILQNTFASLSSLQTLVLSNNKIKFIPNYAFDSLNNIMLLALDNNEISTIGDNAFENCTKLEHLHLNDNLLSQIPVSLKNIPNVQILDLDSNRITDISVSSFPSMQQLIGLRLTGNNISHLAKGVFDKLPELQIINLSNNKIEKIEPGTFDGNLKIVAIRIDGNYITDVGGLFSKLPNLVWLNISENFLQWFDYALIPPGLQWLDIHGNKITELENRFEIENELQLKVFDASNNMLTEITGTAVPDNVHNLYLANNRISKIQSYAFFKKPNLTRVDLTGNQLKVLTLHSLRISAIPPDRNVPEFYIANNPFQCDCTMQWLQSYSVEPERNKPILSDLDTVKCDLLYNRQNTLIPLKDMTPDQFLCKYELECAKRSTCDCCDFDACDCKMICPSNCTCYHSVSSASNVVSCSHYVNSIPERIPMNVTQLYLDGNDIKILSSHSFIGRRLLKILFLNNSNIEFIQNRTFFGLKELEILRLEDNMITSLSGNEFDSLDHLKELYLHNNRITSINSNVFINLYTLSILTLNDNSLSELRKLPNSLQSVKLANNPWNCECEFLYKFQDYIKYENIIDNSDIKCRNGTEEHLIISCNVTAFCIESRLEPNITNPSIESNTTKQDLMLQKADFHHFIPFILVTFCIIFTIAISLLILCIYKEEMRVWCYSKFGVRLFYPTSEIEMDDRDKLFDAYVSYSFKDEIFVTEELAPILQNGDPSYQLCLYYRDFPIGAYMSDTIVQAIESSRRTVVVLSENFIKSEWCSYEFRSAHYQLLRDRRKRLIVILLGDVTQKDLDPDIRLMLRNNPCLQWGDKLFWEKLKFALPDVPNNQRHNKNRNRHHSIHRHHNTRNHNNSLPNNRSVAIHI